MKYWVGDTEISYEATGEAITGPTKVLVEDAIDLTSKSVTGASLGASFYKETVIAFMERSRVARIGYFRIASIPYVDNFS